jgi:hypothetical protein
MFNNKLSTLALPGNGSPQYELVPSPLRKFHTSPMDVLSSAEDTSAWLGRHTSDLEDRKTKDFPTREPNVLTITEMIVILVQEKQIKNIEKILLWATLCDLVLHEKISTFDLESEDKLKSFGIYVFNKKQTGNDIMDEVLDHIVKKNGSKRIVDVMKDVESMFGKKIYGQICMNLVCKGIFAIQKTGKILKHSTYKLIKQDLEFMLKDEIYNVLVQVEKRLRDEIDSVSGMDPHMYALIGMLSRHGTTLQRDILEAKDVILQKAATDMVKHYNLWKQGIVSAVILERLYHVVG